MLAVVAAAFAASSLPLPALAVTTAIVGGMTAIGDGSQPIADGTVIFRDGHIVAAGANVAVPPGATVIDAHGKWVAAGMVAGFTALGIGSHSMLPELNDASAAHSPFSAAIDVTVAINSQDAPIQVDRAVGITRAIVVPSASGSIFGGQGAVIDLGVDREAVTRPRAFQYVELGETGGRIAGGSRPAAYAFFNEALAEARDYARTPSTARREDSGAVLTRADVAALVPVLQGKQPLLVHVERASDILQVLSLQHEYPQLRLILAGASEGWMVATQIAAAHVPVISEAIEDNPAAFESLAATESNVGRMTRAGVTVAISTIDAGFLETYLRQMAANLVAITKVPGATGLSWGQAFAAVTSKPAEVMGMDGEIGSLRPGRRADVVIWDGDPLEVASAPVAVFIDGVSQPLDNHLTKLRDRYRNPEEGALPKAYGH
jgi:imidazolonepropionase-like amidohydrolase